MTTTTSTPSSAKGAWALTVAGLLLGASVALLGQEPPLDLEATLARVGAQLERRYQRVQRIISTETVWVRSFTRDMQSNGPPRQLEFERRVEWGTSEEDGVATVTVFRVLRKVNGREPEPRDHDACLMPRSESEDPLSALLPARQGDYEFSLGELERVDGRRVARLDFLPLEEGRAEVTWDNECVSISLDGRRRGQAWVDVESGEVLRLDERLTGRFEFSAPDDRRWAQPGRMALERDDVSIRYERVAFSDPAETLMLPRSIERNWTLQGSGFVPRYYRLQQFSDHRRFVTDGRVVGASESPSEPAAR